MVDTHDPLSSPSSASENEHAHVISLIPGQQCVAAGLIVLESQSSGHDFRGVSLCPGIIIWGQKSRDKFARREMNFCRHPAPSWLYQRAWHPCSAQQAAGISISAKSFGSTQMLQRSLSALRQHPAAARSLVLEFSGLDKAHPGPQMMYISQVDDCCWITARACPC